MPHIASEPYPAACGLSELRRVTVRLEPIDWVPVLAALLLCALLGLVAGIEPGLAVAAALAIAFVLLTFADLAFGLAILVIVVFAESTPLAGSVLSATKLTGLLLGLAWFARLATQAGRARVLLTAHPGLSILLGALVAWAGLSVVWADDGNDAIVETSRLLLVVLLYVIVYTAIRTRRDLLLVIGGFVVGAASTAAYGLVLRPTVDGATADRLVSTIADPNLLAAILVAGLTLAAAASIATRGSPGWRLGAAAAGAVCLIAFLLTGSRGGLVALAAALVAAVAVAGRARAKVLGLGTLLVACTLAFYVIYAPADIRERVGGASLGEVQQEETRLTIWTIGWRMAEDNAVIGVGAGNFIDSSRQYVLEPGILFSTGRVVDAPAAAHNTYLQAFAELGIVGVTLYLAIIVASLVFAFKAARAFGSRGDWQMEVLARGVIVATVGVLAANFFISELSGKYTWLLMALGPAMLGVARSDPGPPESAEP